jgi:hypothetical protein
MKIAAYLRGTVGAAFAAAVLALAAPAWSADQSMNRFGGPVYGGPAEVTVTAALYTEGGGAGAFSSVRALNSIFGDATVTAELLKLRGGYGNAAVDQFVKVFDYAVSDAWQRAGQSNITFPTSSPLSGHELAVALVQAGTATDHTFWFGTLLDRTLTHKVHVQVMSDIDTKFGGDADTQFHRIANQMFYDLAQDLKLTETKLAAAH